MSVRLRRSRSYITHRMLESRFDGVASWTIDMDARVGIEPSDVGSHAFGSDMRADDDVDDVADADA